MRKKFRRDKWGRFAPKRGKKLKPYRQPARDKLGRFASPAAKGTPQKHKHKHKWRTIQEGKWLPVHATGYYVVIRALVPGGWDTDTTPVFIVEAPKESLNLIIWRTHTYKTLFSATESELLRDVLADAKSLAEAELGYAEAKEKEIIVLSCELRCIFAPRENFQVAVWPGITPPKWLRNVVQ